MSEKILEDCDGHNTDPVGDEVKKIMEFVSGQNVEVENKNSTNVDSEVVDLDSKFGHTVESISTDQRDDKADDQTEGTGPMKTFRCDDIESSNMVYNNRTKEKGPSLDNEEYKRDKGTAYDHKDSEYMTDHNDCMHERAGIKQNPSLGSNADSVSNEVQENNSGSFMAVEENKNDVDAIPNLQMKEIQGGEESMMTSLKKSFSPSSDVSGLTNFPATAQKANGHPSHIAGIKIAPEQPPLAIIAGKNAPDLASAVYLSDQDGCINDQTTSGSGADAARPVGPVPSAIAQESLEQNIHRTGIRESDTPSAPELVYVDDVRFTDEQVASGSREGLILGGSYPGHPSNVQSPISQATDQQTTFMSTQKESPRALPEPALSSAYIEVNRSSEDQSCSSNVSVDISTLVTLREYPNQTAGFRVPQEQSPSASSEAGKTQSSSVGLGSISDGTGTADHGKVRYTDKEEKTFEVGHNTPKDISESRVIDLEGARRHEKFERNLGNTNALLKDTKEASNNSREDSLQEGVECLKKQHEGTQDKYNNECRKLKENKESCEKLASEKEDLEKFRKDQEKQDLLKKLNHSNNDPVSLKTEKAELEQRSSKELFKDSNNRSCAECSIARRVKDMRSLQRGQHISFPGVHSNIYFQPLGKLISPYHHHAVVKRIVQNKVTLIHYWKEDSKIEVYEQTREFNLQEHELYIIEYPYPRYSPDVIVERAESILKQKENWEIFNSYDFLTENCEDFAIWCVLGEERSLQADTFFNRIIQILWNIIAGSCLIASLLNKVTNVPLVVLGICSAASIIYCIYRTVCLVYRIKQYRNRHKVSSDFLNEKLLDLWQQFGAFSLTAVIMIAIVNYAMPNVPLVILGTCSTASIYCFIKSVYLIKRYRNDKKICRHCLNEKPLDLWLQLGAFGLTSAISFAIVNFALPLQIPVIAVPITVGLVLGGTALTLVVPRIRKALWSPVQYSEKEIKTLSEMKLGDVASLTYRGFRHLVVVSEVKWDDDPKQGTVRGIHYSLPSLFGTREIVEEILRVDLKRSKVNIVQFNTLFTFSPGEVMDRARKRIGERKWNISSNISDHLCQWAKVKSEYNFEETECLEDDETRNTHSSSLSSLLVGKADVHLMNEIQLGDVVEYGSDKGIVVRLEDVKDGRVFDMHVVIRKSCFDYRGRQVLDRIDLNKDNLVVHRYHPVHCVSRRERVEKAQSMIGKTIQSWTQFGFIENIILRPRENK